jgi:hypothetical protein
MKTRLLIIAIAVASVFTAQMGVASAKSSTKSSAAKKHHKKHMKKTSGTKLTAPAAPAVS